MALLAWVLAFAADALAIRSARIISTFSAEARGKWRAFPERTAAAAASVPDFAGAVRRHEVIAAIERSAASGARVTATFPLPQPLGA